MASRSSFSRAIVRSMISSNVSADCRKNALGTGLLGSTGLAGACPLAPALTTNAPRITEATKDLVRMPTSYTSSGELQHFWREHLLCQDFRCEFSEARRKD